MKAPQAVSRSTAALAVQILLWAWLIGLSVIVGLGYRVMTELADWERVDTGLRQSQVLEARVTELADGMQALEARPAPATAAELQAVRQALEPRIGQVEQAQESRATTDDLQALRNELEQIRAHQATARTAAPPQVRSPKPAAATPRVAPFPYRVVGAELRAGQRAGQRGRRGGPEGPKSATASDVRHVPRGEFDSERVARGRSRVATTKVGVRLPRGGGRPRRKTTCGGRLSARRSALTHRSKFCT